MPVISTNLAANSAVRYLNMNSAMQTSSLSKLASGSRITQASDDAAGLAISTKISSDVTSLAQAATNASHGISVLQTADGGASNISDILQRMKALASQSASGTVTDNERAYIDAEFSQLTEEIDAIAVGTRYNGQSLLDGSSAFAKGVAVMVGSDAADIISVSLDKLTAAGLGIATTAGISNKAGTATTTTGTVAHTAALGAPQTFLINGNSITLSTTPATAAAMATEINTQLTALGVTDILASASGTNIRLTATQAGSDQSIIVSGGAGATAVFGATPTVVPGTDSGTAPASVTLTINSAAVAYNASGGDVSFDVNGVTVNLSKTGSANNDGSYSQAELVKAINDALGADSDVKALVGSATTIVLSNAKTGKFDKIEVNNFKGMTGSAAAAATAGGFGMTYNVATSSSSADTQAKAIKALGVLDQAINQVSAARASIGSLESRFGFHQASIATSIENLTAANSAIEDTDVASEAAKLASAKVKTQAAVAAAAQASQMPQELLKLMQ